MADIRAPEKGCLFSGFISSDLDLIEKANRRFCDKFSCAVSFESPVWDFSKRTGYYNREMGENLLRKFYVYDLFCEINVLIDAKILSNNLESLFSEGRCRKVNIDPGWIAMPKLVLASAKNFSHRIHLGKGIYVELTMYYKEDDWQSLPWTYPDFNSDYRNWFKSVRKKLFFITNK